MRWIQACENCGAPIETVGASVYVLVARMEDYESVETRVCGVFTSVERVKGAVAMRRPPMAPLWEYDVVEFILDAESGGTLLGAASE